MRRTVILAVCAVAFLGLTCSRKVIVESNTAWTGTIGKAGDPSNLLAVSGIGYRVFEDYDCGTFNTTTGWNNYPPRPWIQAKVEYGGIFAPDGKEAFAWAAYALPAYVTACGH